MIYASDISELNELQCTLYHISGEAQDFTLDVPNRDNLFTFTISYDGSGQYRDANFKLRKGNIFPRVQLTFKYESHRMNLAQLLACEYLKFNRAGFNDRLNLPFNNLRFIVMNKEVTKNWFNGMAITEGDSGNPVPSGEFDLELKSTEKFMPRVQS